MKILCELYKIIKELDELNCSECGEELESDIDFDIGVCADCRGVDKRRGSQFDGAREEDCQYMEYYTDAAGNVLTEAAVRMYKKVGKEIKRKYRCTSGPKKGQPVTDPSKCAQRKDPKKIRQGRKNMRKGKATRKRKAKITKRTAKSKMVARLNKTLKGGTSSGAKPAVNKTKKKTIKRVLPKSSTTMRPVKAKKPIKAKKTK